MKKTWVAHEPPPETPELFFGHFTNISSIPTSQSSYDGLVSIRIIEHTPQTDINETLRIAREALGIVISPR